MTVSYNLDVSSITHWNFLKLIFRWRGSIWKSVYFEVTTWLLSYYVVMVIYRQLLDDEQQRIFAYFAQQCDKKLDWIPLTFMLGFFVTIVIDRWKNIFANIGFVDNAALFLSTYLQGDKETRICRRNIVRYLCLTQVLVLRDVSVPVRKRFPTMESIMSAGFLNKPELETLERINNGFSKYWIPINWIFSILYEQRQKDTIKCDLFLNVILQEVRSFRDHLQFVVNYDWVPVPLSYPQVVYLAVRSYFVICVVSRQHIIDEAHIVGDKTLYLVDLYFPVMTVLQLIFFFGWMKVAEALLNPLGCDDDDFETNFILDRNLAIALSIVDTEHGKYPEQGIDSFVVTPVPQNEPANGGMVPALVGSASQLDLSQLDQGATSGMRRRSSFLAGKLREHLSANRRTSRTISASSVSPELPDARHENGWVAQRRPTLYVSDPVNLPTIRSIDEVLSMGDEVVGLELPSDSDKKYEEKKNPQNGEDKPDDKTKRENPGHDD